MTSRAVVIIYNDKYHLPRFNKSDFACPCITIHNRNLDKHMEKTIKKGFPMPIYVPCECIKSALKAEKPLEKLQEFISEVEPEFKQRFDSFKKKHSVTFLPPIKK